MLAAIVVTILFIIAVSWIALYQPEGSELTNVKQAEFHGVPKVKVENTLQAPTRRYSEEENRLSSSDLTWAEFVSKSINKQREPLELSLSRDVTQSMHVCGRAIVGNLSKTLSADDKAWCIWAVNPSGGKVVLGETYGSLSQEDISRFERLQCQAVAKGQEPSCDEEYGDGFILRWENHAVPGLCEENAPSKAMFYAMDQLQFPQCVFVYRFDAMMAEHPVCVPSRMPCFKKMRTRPKAGLLVRSWEKGFLTADCGYTAPDNIGYLQIYKPDIEGTGEAVCDFVFNETVLVYSHDNIKSLPHMVEDYLNVWTMLWVTGLDRYSQDISLLNIDGLRSNHFNRDQINENFKPYEKKFRRILKASDFGSSATACFKRLVMPPRPPVPYLKDGWTKDMTCSSLGPSSVFQRWNIQLRHMFGALKSPFADKHAINKKGIAASIQILLILSPRYRNSSLPAAVGMNRKSMTTRLSSRIIRNEKTVVQLLLSLKTPSLRVVVQDLSTMSVEGQIKLITTSNILVGMHGQSFSQSIYLPVGAPRCCGVVEIFPHGKYSAIRGFGNLARRVGAKYRRLDLAEEDSSALGTTVNIPALNAVLGELLAEIDASPSCVLPGVLSQSLS